MSSVPFKKISLLPAFQLLFLLLSFGLLFSCSGGGGGGDNIDALNGVGTECNPNQCGIVGLNSVSGSFLDRSTIETVESSEQSSRIINGQQCDRTDSPIVQLSIAPPGDFADVCSGTFLTANVVLTAGHCLPTGSSEGIFVLHNGERIPAQEVVVHPDIGIDAETNLILNDVGIVILSIPVVARTLPIIVSKQPAVEEKISIFGFGLNENSIQGEFNSGQMEIVEVLDTHHISLFEKPCSNTCAGDSGGPSIQIALNRWEEEAPGILGILSSGESRFCEEGDRSAFITLSDPPILDFILSLAPSAGLL